MAPLAQKIEQAAGMAEGVVPLSMDVRRLGWCALCCWPLCVRCSLRRGAELNGLNAGREGSLFMKLGAVARIRPLMCII
jgi:hypothetical protein